MRAELSGVGDPISEVALPIANEEGVDPGGGMLAPLLITLNDGEEFIPEDYMAVGYSHYDVYVVGAAGGKGSDAINEGDIDFVKTQTYEVAPSDIWTSVITDAYERAVYDHVLTFNWNGTLIWAWEVPERINPDHRFEIWTYTDPYIRFHGSNFPNPTAFGGGGGGGGLQVITDGRLDALPETVPITVGVPGKEAPPGQIVVEGDWNPLDYFQERLYTWNHQLDNVYPSRSTRLDWQTRFPDSDLVIPNPGYGTDGGYSAFGDIAKASGGKGGSPAVIFTTDDIYDYDNLTSGDSRNLLIEGHGGDGGKGGRIEAGGGGLGAFILYRVGPSDWNWNGKDGVWDPVTMIGEGGGGGSGGWLQRSWDTFGASSGSGFGYAFSTNPRDLMLGVGA